MVVGSSGRVGGLVVEGLVAAGQRVRAVARNPGSGGPGVTPHAADVRDTGALRPVLRGATGIFLNLPPLLTVEDLRKVAGEIRASGIATVVLLSSDLVGLYPGSVMAAPHEREENVLGEIFGNGLVSLRPGMFMDNDITEWAPSIRCRDEILTAFPESLQLPVAPVDIAAHAVEALTSGSVSATSPRYVLGPQWLCARERAAIIAATRGRPVAVRQISPADYRALLARALPEPIAHQKAAMLATAPQSIVDCPDPGPGGERTPYSAWAAANVSSFTGGDR